MEESFRVPAPLEGVWSRLLDVEAVVPCMPGASLTAIVDTTHWRGAVDVSFGPVSLTYRGEVELVERDDGAHRMVLQGTGAETHGRGNATTTVILDAEQVGHETTVSLSSEIAIAGAAAQLSRGFLPQVVRQLTREFAANLAESVNAAAPPGAAKNTDPPAAPPPRPIGGLRLVLHSFTSWLRGSRR